MDEQEKYLAETKLAPIILRGTKKLITELTSIKTLFLGFICVAAWFDKISDMWVIIGGLAVLGVKEIPTEVFTAIIQKMVPNGQK